MSLEIKVRNQIIAAMRRISRYYPPRVAAKNLCKVDTATFACSKCGKYCYEGTSEKNFLATKEAHPDKVVVHEKIELDHIDPVVDPKIGYVDLQTYAERLFCTQDGFRALCSFCHRGKSSKEAKVRNKTRKRKKDEKETDSEAYHSKS